MIDMSGDYEKAIRANAPGAEICFDPFHVVRLAQHAVDQVRRDERKRPRNAHTPRRTAESRAPAGRCSRRPPSSRSANSRCSTKSNTPTRRSTARPCSKKSCGCSTHPDDHRLAAAHLDAWLTWASRSRLVPFVRLARTIRRHPRRHPPRTLQRPPRRTQPPHPPNQPPQLRPPHRRTPDRSRLPLLHRHRHRSAAMNFTPKRPKRQT